MGRTDLVIEAIVENIGVKHKLFTALDAAAPPVSILLFLWAKLAIPVNNPRILMIGIPQHQVVSYYQTSLSKPIIIPGIVCCEQAMFYISPLNF